MRTHSLIAAAACLPASLLVVAVAPSPARAVEEAWVRTAHGPGGLTDEAWEVKAGGAGDAYVTGWAWGGSGARYDILTVKYDASGNEVWRRTYDRAGATDLGKGLALDDSGDAWVTGYSDGQLVTIKYDALGNAEWTRLYPATSWLGFNKNQDIEVDAGGNAYVCGVRYQGNADVLVLKYTPAGDLAWVRTYDGPSHLDDEPWNVAVDASHVYVTGYSHDGGEDFQILTIKYEQADNPAPVWVRRWNGAGSARDIAFGLEVNEGGNVYVAGESFGVGTGLDCVTLEYDAGGDLLWQRTWNGTGNDADILADLALDAAGNVYVAGQTANGHFPSTDFDYIVIKYTAAGAEAWARTYDGPAPGSNDYAYEIEVDGAGNAYVTGDEFEGPTGADNDRNLVTRKYDTNGNLAWSMTYDGPGASVDYGRSIALDAAGNVFVCGLADLDPSNAGIDYDYVTVKYREPGASVAAAAPAAGPGRALRAVPNPFAAFAAVSGHEGERFDIYDPGGRRVGACRGDRVAADVRPGVYFVVPADRSVPALQVVKVR